MRFTTRQYIRQECEKLRTVKCVVTQIYWIPQGPIPKYVILGDPVFKFGGAK
jgi:hypothetical protein